MRLFLRPLCIYLCLCASAFAHAPYYSDEIRLSGPGGETLSLKILNGDGIIVADPQQAIIVDDTGRFLAGSPIAEALSAFCAASARVEDCVVYDAHFGMLYQPLPSRFEPRSVIEKDGKPTVYPDYGTAVFGFSVRKASPWEIAGYELLNLRTAPVITALAVAWWTLLFRVGLPILTDVRDLILGRTPTLEFVSALSIRTFLVALILFLTFLGWMVSFYSVWYLAFCAGSGCLLANLLLFWRRNPQDGHSGTAS
ncbi:hypothetical protein [Roseibium sediminicola]|uniref:Uncharacterized protein n=1 Tax=Roseibium sediminicola TaxID=2933272 RepID=A0ABT0GYA3_9HYPH|nr:hypothetical protein [Roseibium sp. CAU 1639]MCK7614414.1 hypothetical protein [Roseibium sp. CAU 1639]